ncbi:ATP-binding SpoIIE family protein phosphatase [Streptomyces sp. NPDC091272]|uniref:ATP-binding SpoIIE family protein phosphatase n=1 Tax=Streptomyces sp. NPDC091272 TaxID=3365981 RepID=UPI0038164C7B
MNATLLSAAEDVVWLRAGEALAMAARREAGTLALRLGMTNVRVAQVELAATEVATNLMRHADDGALILRVSRAADGAALELLSLDSGPGIPDVETALRDGHSQGGTLGIGLGAVARLSDEFDVHSLADRGTLVLARFWAPGSGDDRGAARTTARHVGGLTRPISGESVCGDAWAARAEPSETGGTGRVMAMMCDGLGHGPLAARASERARQVFQETSRTTLTDIVREIHEALRGTRGAALCVVSADFRTHRVEACGVGNISAFAVDGHRRGALLSLPGIVGSHLPHLRTFDAPLPPGSTVVLHSDGLKDRWMPAEFPGLFSRQPVMIAGQILGQAGVRRDDAGIVVITTPGS